MVEKTKYNILYPMYMATIFRFTLLKHFTCFCVMGDDDDDLKKEEWVIGAEEDGLL
jgi:hypothetical protein